MPRQRPPVDKPIDQPERGPAIPTAQAPARTRVDVDTWVTRADLGPTCRTFVAKGDLVPHGLDGFPREAA